MCQSHSYEVVGFDLRTLRIDYLKWRYLFSSIELNVYYGVKTGLRAFNIMICKFDNIQIDIRGMRERFLANVKSKYNKILSCNRVIWNIHSQDFNLINDYLLIIMVKNRNSHSKCVRYVSSQKARSEVYVVCELVHIMWFYKFWV